MYIHTNIIYNTYIIFISLLQLCFSCSSLLKNATKKILPLEFGTESSYEITGNHDFTNGDHDKQSTPFLFGQGTKNIVSIHGMQNAVLR